MIRRFAALTTVLALICTMCLSVYAGEYDDGSVVYRQSFSDVSTPENAGVRKGERNFNGFSLSIRDDALFMDCHSDTRSFAVLPYYNDLDEYTVETGFSFKDIKSPNAYFSLMLTSMGELPDNVAAVSVRANGKCDQFGELDAAIVEKISAGDTVHLTVPVKHGMLSSVTVSVGNMTQTLRTDDVMDVPYGFPGFIVRNSSAYIYDVTVTSGTGYTDKTGDLAESSVYTDEMPYGNYLVSTCDDSAGMDSPGFNTFVLSPATGDMMVVCAVIVAVSAVLIVVLLKKRKLVL